MTGVRNAGLTHSRNPWKFTAIFSYIEYRFLSRFEVTFISCLFDFLCFLRLIFLVNLESHSSRGYFTHLSHWYLTPYMNPKMAFFSKFRVTFIAWIFHTFMQCQNMSLEMCLPSTFVVTFIAWILESTLHCCCCVCNNQGLLMRCLI